MDQRPKGGRLYSLLPTLLLICVLLIFGQARSAMAQVDEGAISGTVTDPSGAVVPGAHVTLLNKDQGLSLESTSNNSGEYTFSPVRIGHYSISATAPGFATTTLPNLSVSVGQRLQANVELKAGSTTTTVEVTTEPPQLQTSEASVGQVIDQRTVNSLPLNGRNFTFLAQLSAGVNTPQADTRGNAASGAFSANGLRPAQNNYLLDGIDNNSNAVDFLNGTNFVILPPLDAIQEFKVQTADFSAELGRSAGAVLNATIKSGTNSLHGAVWEFFRNDILDAADYFETNGKSELRFNQFGASAGGPIIKNKIFFFGDYEGFRRVQGSTTSGVSVPTLLERNSGYTDLSDMITGQGTGTITDKLGRVFPAGTVMDPTTTRAIAAGAVDPISGYKNTSSDTVYARDPFGTCSPSTKVFTLAACNLNQLPAGRLDPTAIKLLNLFPNPTDNTKYSSNFQSSPSLYEHRNAFDVRGDVNPSDKDQAFVRFSYVDDPQFIPGPFGGVADGGAFQQGIQTLKTDQAVAAWTHVFSPATINVARIGFNHLHTTRFGPEGNTSGIPEQYGINGIPQAAENGGLPSIDITGLSQLGSNDFLPSDEVSQTWQVTDDFTKIYGKHSFKTGIEYQDVHFNTLQPAYSRGEFDFDGNTVDVANVDGGNVGRAQFLLTPAAATVPGGIDYVGGASTIHASNISKTYDTRTYFAAYFQDDWKITPNFTLNLGIRYDYFSPISESNGAQANFVQTGPPNGGPIYLIPASGKADRSLSSTANNPSLNGNGFLDLLAKDGIALGLTNKYGKALVQTQKANFAPRFGFAYQTTPKLVIRGGLGLFYNSFENQGYGPNIGENYPFVYNFNYNNGGNDYLPFSAGANPYGSCSSAGPGGSAPIGVGLSCSAFTPLAVNASGLSLQGLQFDYQTPRTLSANLTMQYAITPTLSFQAGYVLTDGSDLQTGIGNNSVSQLLPSNANTKDFVPFPDFGQGGSYQRTLGSSIYNGLQTKLEQQFSNGLMYLVTYTYSKTMSDAGDLLNGGSTSGLRAPWVPGLGPRFDWSLADFDVRNVIHISGGYQLPVGKGQKFLANANKMENSVLGGWAVNWIVTLQGGQPLTLGCPSGTTAGTSCYDVRVPGQSMKLGLHHNSNGQLAWLGNPAAFQQPCQLGSNDTPAGCVPLTGAGVLGGTPSTTYGPGFHRFDFSMFKNIPFSERYSVQFRAEFFNILNHPNFNAPGFGGNGVQSISGATNFNNSNFGAIGSTRDAPYDPRQIQFALKFYY
jgi:hypothetical protein